jgi:hypothetical protein
MTAYVEMTLVPSETKHFWAESIKWLSERSCRIVMISQSETLSDVQRDFLAKIFRLGAISGSAGVNKWPGTTTASRNAVALEMRASKAVAELIGKCGPELAAYVEPEFFEDICFYHEQAPTEVLFGSITHEREYWIRASAEEVEEFKKVGGWVGV